MGWGLKDEPEFPGRQGPAGTEGMVVARSRQRWVGEEAAEVSRAQGEPGSMQVMLRAQLWRWGAYRGGDY